MLLYPKHEVQLLITELDKVTKVKIKAYVKY